MQETEKETKKEKKKCKHGREIIESKELLTTCP